MNFFQKNQKVILLLILSAGAFYVYTTFFEPDSTVSATSPDAEQVGNEVLTLYNSLQSVTLDQKLFTSKLYTSLVDFSSPLPEQIPGRSNPFAEIGHD